jgi:hypothetical protein
MLLTPSESETVNHRGHGNSEPMRRATVTRETILTPGRQDGIHLFTSRLVHYQPSMVGDSKLSSPPTSEAAYNTTAAAAHLMALTSCLHGSRLTTTGQPPAHYRRATTSTTSTRASSSPSAPHVTRHRHRLEQQLFVRQRSMAISKLTLPLCRDASRSHWNDTVLVNVIVRRRPGASDKVPSSLLYLFYAKSVFYNGSFGAERESKCMPLTRQALVDLISTCF